MGKGAAILLAAGRSQRFGRDKTRLVLDGETLLERHVRQLGDAADELIVVANVDNRASITADPGVRRTGARVVIQPGETVESAIAEGLRMVGERQRIYLSCVNDLVPDDSYCRLAELTQLDDMTISVATSDRPFPGGLVEFGPDGTVRSIREKPLGGCPPGSLVNVFLHCLGGVGVAERILARLDHGQHYEKVLTVLASEGLVCRALRLSAWCAIKRPDDWDRLLADDAPACALRRRPGIR